MENEIVITDEETAIKINNIINKNKVEDLLRFMNKRQNINCSNQFLGYLFYVVQTLAMFGNSLGQYTQNDYLIWSSIGLTGIGTLIHAIINSNNKINSSLMANIKAIHSGDYVDEVNVDALEEKKGGNTPVIAKVPKIKNNIEV
jgi:ABC-type antimicrobial peptide transport system permease subunit